MDVGNDENSRVVYGEEDSFMNSFGFCQHVIQLTAHKCLNHNTFRVSRVNYAISTNLYICEEMIKQRLDDYLLRMAAEGIPVRV